MAHVHKSHAGIRVQIPDALAAGEYANRPGEITWVNFGRQSAGVGQNTLYVKVFPDQKLFAIEERIIANNATLTPITVDGTPQHLYADFPDIPTTLIASNTAPHEHWNRESRQGTIRDLMPVRSREPLRATESLPRRSLRDCITSIAWKSWQPER